MWTPPKRFESAALEKAFLADYCQRFASHRRIAGILGLLITAAYILWDYLYGFGDAEFAPVLGAVVLNRSLTAALILPYIALSFTERFARDEGFASRIIVVTLGIQFAFYCRGFLLVPFPYDYMYFFMGMFICQIYGFSMPRLRARPSILLMSACVLLAMLTFAWNWQIKHDTLTSPAARIYVWVAASFLVSVGVMGVFVCTLLESSERASFLRKEELAGSLRLISQRNEEVERLNQALRISMQAEQERADAVIALKERLRQESERRNREKSQFLAAAVHDLKQPIQAIGNALEPGRRALAQYDFEQARNMFELAASATQLMREQLSGVLEISRLESGFVSAELGAFDVIPLIDNVFSQLGNFARRHEVLLRSSAPAGPVIVFGDRHFMGRILLNLVSNGIKYHDPDKRDSRWVEVGLSLRGDTVLITVEDNGVGIEASLISSEAIFKPFFQANNRYRESEKGVGLGLSIVQAMIALLPEHRLSVRSQVGTGTCMTLQAPRGRPGQRLPEILSPSMVLDDGLGEAALAALVGCYVLYVEDDELVRTSTSALLDAYGILHDTFDACAGLRAALPMIERVPDFLLTDYRLPDGATAHDVVDAVRDEFGPVPALVITGEVLDEDTLPGDWLLLRKPLSTAQLLRTFCDVTARRPHPAIAA